MLLREQTGLSGRQDTGRILRYLVKLLSFFELRRLANPEPQNLSTVFLIRKTGSTAGRPYTGPVPQDEKIKRRFLWTTVQTPSYYLISWFLMGRISNRHTIKLDSLYFSTIKFNFVGSHAIASCHLKELTISQKLIPSRGGAIFLCNKVGRDRWSSDLCRNKFRFSKTVDDKGCSQSSTKNNAHNDCSDRPGSKS